MPGENLKQQRTLTALLQRGAPLTCPSCAEDTRVIESGWSVRWEAKARRRQCKGCRKQFYTIETIVEGSLFTPKKPHRIK